MNVTLVYPCLRNFGGWNSLGKHPDTCFILHGLPSLAACLQHDGHTVRLLDLRERTSWNDTADWLRHDNADLYGIYMSTLDYHEAKGVANLVRQLKPHATTVVGGPHPSICPDQLAQDPAFDHVFAGEGEVTFPKLVADPDAYPKIVHGEHPDLDSLPYENREIFNMRRVLATKNPTHTPPPFINVISGRGCPYNCAFCKPGEDLIFGKFRMRSVEHFIGEIEMVHRRYHYGILVIDDDLFTMFPDYVMRFCDEYERRIDRVPFSIQSRADLCVQHPDVFKRLKEAGCVSARFGFESGNQRILNLMRKGTTVQQNYDAMRLCKRLGIRVIANYMVGNPTETQAELLDTLRMIRTCDPDWKSAAFYTPIVGTDMYEDCKRRGLLVSHDPTVLGTRSISNQPRLRGVDYHWIQTQMYGRFYRQRHWARKQLNRQSMQPLRRVVVPLLKRVL